MLQAISDRLTRSATIALLLSPAGLLIIAAARLLIISDYNTATASAIVSSSGYVNTLLGTIIPLIPIIMPYLALIALFLESWRSWLLHSSRPQPLPAGQPSQAPPRKTGIK
jgi:phosphoglycerol transferase MdoB-like AlkP superfamily enzyme